MAEGVTVGKDSSVPAPPMEAQVRFWLDRTAWAFAARRVPFGQAEGQRANVGQANVGQGGLLRVRLACVIGEVGARRVRLLMAYPGRCARCRAGRRLGGSKAGRTEGWAGAIGADDHDVGRREGRFGHQAKHDLVGGRPQGLREAERSLRAAQRFMRAGPWRAVQASLRSANAGVADGDALRGFARARENDDYDHGGLNAAGMSAGTWTVAEAKAKFSEVVEMARVGVT